MGQATDNQPTNYETYFLNISYDKIKFSSFGMQDMLYLIYKLTLDNYDNILYILSILGRYILQFEVKPNT